MIEGLANLETARTVPEPLRPLPGAPTEPFRPLGGAVPTPAVSGRAPDSRRYEVIDGRMVVTGVQPPAHQAAVVALMVLLKQACPTDLLVSVGSLDFRPTRRLSLRPDILVTSRAEAGPQYVQNAVLAVEVLSPTTRVIDVVTKRELYAQHGVPAYWLLDPSSQELTILHLTGNHYVCEAVVQGEEVFTTTHPFPVTLSPIALTR